MRKSWYSLVFFLAPSLAFALGPHEVAVLVNEDSTNSIAIAREFARLRNVPVQNIIRLKPYGQTKGQPIQISQEDFTKNIWLPANKTLRNRKIDDHILAWVYSADFPTTIMGNPCVSITGQTFLRNKLLEPVQIDKARYISPLFCSPMKPVGKGYRPQTFDATKSWLGDEMPLPAMMLGVMGELGNNMETINSCLKKGALSDGTFPTGTIYFVMSKDARSECRQWQFPGACVALADFGIRSVITTNFPAGRKDILGLLMGGETANPEQNTGYLPGCMAEHLTSLAGVFSGPNQTKLTAWIHAGATASAGTVVEPYSAWPKFPHAFFYVYYVSGCAMIECFYQSIRSPLQILPVGDPLASPWAKTADVSVTGIPTKAAAGTIHLQALAKPKDPSILFRHFTWLVDGVTFREGASLDLDTKKLTDGPHKLRLVVRSSGAIRHQSFYEKAILVYNPDPNPIVASENFVTKTFHGTCPQCGKEVAVELLDDAGAWDGIDQSGLVSGSLYRKVCSKCSASLESHMSLEMLFGSNIIWRLRRDEDFTNNTPLKPQSSTTNSAGKNEQKP